MPLLTAVGIAVPLLPVIRWEVEPFIALLVIGLLTALAAGLPAQSLATGLAGLIFGVPVFFDVGIFVLAPLVYVAAKQGGRSILLYCPPLPAGLSVTHAFLPPHPGPRRGGRLLGVDLGW